MDALTSQIYFGMKLYMFRSVPLSIIRSLFTVHSGIEYVIQVCRQLSSRIRLELHFHPDHARKLYSILYVVQVCRQLSSRTKVEVQFHPGLARKQCVECLYDIYRC
jgi:hypothetical protein